MKHTLDLDGWSHDLDAVKDRIQELADTYYGNQKWRIVETEAIPVVDTTLSDPAGVTLGFNWTATVVAE